MLKNQTLVVVCGWPVSGKGTVARGISMMFGTIPVLDIDENIRLPMFGQPHPEPNVSEYWIQRDREEVAASYELLLHATDIHLRLGRSLIIIATFSRETSHHALKAVVDKYPELTTRIILCRPRNDTDAEIQARLDRRRQEGTTSSVTTIERYNEVKNRYQPMKLFPIFELDTSPPNTIAECVAQACQYVIQ